jgi:hypothetical protein
MPLDRDGKYLDLSNRFWAGPSRLVSGGQRLKAGAIEPSRIFPSPSPSPSPGRPCPHPLPVALALSPPPSPSTSSRWPASSSRSSTNLPSSVSVLSHPCMHALCRCAVGVAALWPPSLSPVPVVAVCRSPSLPFPKPLPFYLALAIKGPCLSAHAGEHTWQEAGG